MKEGELPFGEIFGTHFLELPAGGSRRQVSLAYHERSRLSFERIF